MFLLTGILIGLVLGLTGAGGSVFAVPLLIMLTGMSVHQAVGLSLGAVAVTAMFGCLRGKTRKTMLLVPAILLSISGMLLVPVGQWLASQLDAMALVIGFAILAILIAIRMWRMAVRNPESSAITRASDLTIDSSQGLLCRLSPSGQFQMRPRCMSGLLVGGAVVGVLSGMFGVGGGFLIVPLLLYLSQVTFRQAVGTSLLVITVISGVGFISFLLMSEYAQSLPVNLMLWLMAGGVLGMIFGQLLTDKIANARLQKIFAIALIVIVSVMTLNAVLGG
ncbi:permease [Methylophaga lonarensis MPL]|uniref:Probable membrane transporter protein n=1 Tax=Methylophaga lonarensis MPL TaxID=1286106 RepID=M7PGI7_9GAMM|nr:sulfite exporter TauE/SafE family protein [Methylophaga lonarensis]EMR13010.1 permease [Methylophaga lonarensis MPL]